MSRWSVSKIFSKVNAVEFRDAVQTVQAAMEKSCGTPMNVEISLYDRLPSSITSYQEGVNEWLQEQRLKMIFTKASSPKDMTDVMWNKAVYVEAKIVPADKDKAPAHAFGHIEAKGLLPKQMCFYVQPDSPGKTAQYESQAAHKGWRKGDGMDSNHFVTYG